MVSSFSPTGGIGNFALVIRQSAQNADQNNQNIRSEQESQAQQPENDAALTNSVNAPSSPTANPPASPTADTQNIQNNQDQTSDSPLSQEELSPEQEQQVRELQQRDREVRAHEQAHATVGGPYASAPQYQTVRGPDGRQYAVSGEVQIDASPENDPEATIRKMQIVIRAALAPAEPSPQDRQVAQQARQTLNQAQADLREQQQAEIQGEGEEDQGQASSPQNLIEQALQRFQQAEDAQAIGQTRPIQTGDQGDQIDISEQAEQILSDIFG